MVVFSTRVFSLFVKRICVLLSKINSLGFPHLLKIIEREETTRVMSPAMALINSQKRYTNK